MARYRVLETSYINERIVEAGDEITLDGVASANLEPIGDIKVAEASARKALLTEARALGLSLEDTASISRISEAMTGFKQRLTD